MKVESSNEKKQYIHPQIEVIEIETSAILAGSTDPDPDPDVIYPKFND